MCKLRVNFDKFNWTERPSNEELNADFERLKLWVNVKNLPRNVQKYGDKPYSWVRDFMDKIEEEDVNEVYNKGTHRPSTRGERRRATAHAKRKLREKEPFTNSIRKTRNGGIIHKGETYGWYGEWKKSDVRKLRYIGKRACREYMPEDPTITQYIPFVDEIVNW